MNYYAVKKSLFEEGFREMFANKLHRTDLIKKIFKNFRESVTQTHKGFVAVLH